VDAIDCTHIKIPSPGRENAELFRNRKGYFSINVQAVYGPNLDILNIVARWPGSIQYMMPEYSTIVAYIVHSLNVVISRVYYLVITVIHAANI
jgi:hypothetical protein